MGYTPLFGSLTTGTLCGRWPDVGLFPILLSLSDRHGIVDVTPKYLSQVTGLPEDDVVACMGRFCQPDPLSRSKTADGARLVLLDEHRDWGWQIVNHSLYREKARKQTHDIERVASGENAERLKAKRAATRDDPTRTGITRAGPLSDSDSDSDVRVSIAARKPQRPRSQPQLPAFHAAVIAAYHELCAELPKVKIWTQRRRQALDARIAERCAAGKQAHEIKYWRDYFSDVGASAFLCGRRSDFKADLGWLIKPENFAKVVEGNYTDGRKTNGAHAHV